MKQPDPDPRPFEAIPPDLMRRMRPLVGAAADDLLAELTGGTPDTGDASAGELRAAIVDGLRHFYDLAERPRTAWPAIAAAYREVGRRMAVRGRDPEEMHSALRRSAQAIWRTLTALAETLEVDRATLGRIAEAQFGFLDAVAAQVAHGYDTEIAGSDEAVRRHRTRLLQTLLNGGPALTDQSLADAARAAGWRPPRTLAAVALAPKPGASPQPAALSPALPPDVLVDLARTEPCLLLPDPDGPGRSRLLEALLRDWTVVLGPTVPPAQAAESLRWARQALALTRRGRIPDRGVVRCMDHVPTLVIFLAEDLIERAAASRLAPLRALSPVQAERLTETLLSLLENNFNATEAGSDLHVHPQTVRYRLRHLEELFGADLQDPRRCLELEMILRARQAGTADDRAPLTTPA
ncbi:helix-turn-helix domain-containing protein [Actinomadura hibisca]|uniref:helix-turn-helix domain-containing protein n=1 Tax=Actinomadura hibisca TaxID=68565 RepID=UPI00082E7C9B|nr:helix-turn-helix domain-containing protein [Actinomadura hibisca]